LKPETKISLSARISASLQFLGGILDSFWASVVWVFSKLRAPKHPELTPITAPMKSGKKSVSNKLEKKKSKQEKSHPHRVLTGWLLGIATLIGGAVVFLPRPTVTQGDPVDSANAFSAPFTVTNTSVIPLEHVDIGLVIGQFTTAPAKIDPSWKVDWTNPDKRTTFFKPEWKNRYLGMDDKFTVTPDDVFRINGEARLGGGEIAIVVQYEPWFIPWKREKVSRFNAHQQSNGLWYWYAAPLN
jgi:hypothetical protein